METLHVYYDTRFAPITFDFATYLVVAEAFRQSSGFSDIFIHLVNQDFREATARELIYSEEEKRWRSRQILARIPWLIPSVKGVDHSLLTISDVRLPVFPAYYPVHAGRDPKVFPYLSSELKHFNNPKINLKPYSSQSHARQFVSNFLGVNNYLTLTLRTSHIQQNRNNNLDEWYTLYKLLINDGYNVFVVPDFEDLMSTKKAMLYDWNLFIPACFDHEIRLALYQGAILNIAVLNGVLVPMIHSDSNYMICKLLVDGEHCLTEKWHAETFGIQHGENFWWANPSGQELHWGKETAEDLYIAFNKTMDKMNKRG